MMMYPKNAIQPGTQYVQERKGDSTERGDLIT